MPGPKFKLLWLEIPEPVLLPSCLNESSIWNVCIIYRLLCFIVSICIIISSIEITWQELLWSWKCRFIHENWMDIFPFVHLYLCGQQKHWSTSGNKQDVQASRGESIGKTKYVSGLIQDLTKPCSNNFFKTFSLNNLQRVDYSVFKNHDTVA